MITRIFIAVIVIAIVTYDIFALIFLGVDKTISVELFGLSKQFPVIPFALGFVAGHLFWPVRGSAPPMRPVSTLKDFDGHNI